MSQGMGKGSRLPLECYETPRWRVRGPVLVYPSILPGADVQFGAAAWSGRCKAHGGGAQAAGVAPASSILGMAHL